MLKRHVTKAMPIRIIYLLETVEIEMQDGCITPFRNLPVGHRFIQGSPI